MATAPNINESVDVVPGGVNVANAVILNAEGRGCNIKDLIVSIDIFEDIMSPFISGNVVVSDSIALAEMLPLQGEETLILELDTPAFVQAGQDRSDINYQRAMMVHLYKIEAKENAALKNVLYKLSFMSLDAVRDINTKISKTFRGKPSEIAEKILKEETYLGSNKELLIEPCGNQIVYTSNYWSPSKNLMFIAERALSPMNNPNYLFFENSEGFVFASLDALYKYPPITTLFRDQQVRATSKDESNDIEREYTKILDMSTGEHYDYITRATSGMYGSVIYTFDVETKKLNFKTVDGWRDFGQDKISLNAKLPVEPRKSDEIATKLSAPYRPDAKMFVEVSQLNNYNGSTIQSLENNMRRATLLNQAQFNKINIQVFGRFDYTVGRTIDVVIYADKEMLENDSPEDAYDKILSGRYLITACNHSIDRQVHLCNLELSKDSYTDI